MRRTWRRFRFAAKAFANAWREYGKPVALSAAIPQTHPVSDRCQVWHNNVRVYKGESAAEGRQHAEALSKSESGHGYFEVDGLRRRIW